MTITYHLQARVWNSTCSILLDQTKSKPHKVFMLCQPNLQTPEITQQSYDTGWFYRHFCTVSDFFTEQNKVLNIPSSLGIDRGSIDLTLHLMRVFKQNSMNISTMDLQ